MSSSLYSNNKIIVFSQNKTGDAPSRKTGFNKNREGSVRMINGKVYVDFMYQGERVRESSQLDWTAENIKHVQGQLGKTVVSIKSGHFRFAEVFPDSREKDHTSKKNASFLEVAGRPGRLILLNTPFNGTRCLKTPRESRKELCGGITAILKITLSPTSAN